MSSLLNEIKKPKSRVFRRCEIKRRDPSTGLFESEWQDITSHVKRWGRVKYEIDAQGLHRFRLGNITMVMENSSGLFNPEDDENSLWYQFGVQQRSLVRLQAGFVHQTLGADGIWYNTEFPTNAYWDVSNWDEPNWDVLNNLFTGIIYGDINLSGNDEVTLKIAPLHQVFRDYAAINLTGLNGSITASDFMTAVRDHTDGSGNLVFRPFFGDTTTNWSIDTTTRIYAITNTSDFVRTANVWEVMLRLAEAENKTVFTDEAGIFNFSSRDVATTTVSFQFYGTGSHDTTYGHTIKTINSYNQAISKYYSRVEIVYIDANTSTSVIAQEAALVVSPDNIPWLYGQKTLSIENTWVNTATANAIVSDLFTEFSSLKKEIKFDASFVPQLSIRDRISVTYDSTGVRNQSLWDRNNWADASSNELIWDKSVGNAIKLNAKEMKIISVEHNLDGFETSVIAREA